MGVDEPTTLAIVRLTYASDAKPEVFANKGRKPKTKRNTIPAFPGARDELVYVALGAPAGWVPPGVDPDWYRTINLGPGFASMDLVPVIDETTATCSMGHVRTITYDTLSKLAIKHAKAGKTTI